MTHRTAPAAFTAQSVQPSRTPIRNLLQILTAGPTSTDHPLPLVTPNGATTWALPVSEGRRAAVIDWATPASRPVAVPEGRGLERGRYDSSVQQGDPHLAGRAAA
jgi:hypothetical protein